MKEKELRENANCDSCGEGVGKTGQPMFWTVIAERHGLKLDAIQRQDGLGMFLGHSGLAAVMGADEEMTQTLVGPVKISVCEKCATSEICLMDVVMRKVEDE